MRDYEAERFKKLKGKHKHYCPEWDYMAIDEHDREFDACLCYRKEPSQHERTTNFSPDTD